MTDEFDEPSSSNGDVGNEDDAYSVEVVQLEQV
jgi:hypothetical protein